MHLSTSRLNQYTYYLTYLPDLPSSWEESKKGHDGVPYIHISIKSTQIGWGNILPNDDMDKVGATMK